MHFSPSGVAADVPAYFSCDARKSFGAFVDCSKDRHRKGQKNHKIGKLWISLDISF
jgi:hypothetical protein